MGYRFKKLCILAVISLISFSIQAQNKTIFTKDLEILMVADFDWVYNDSGTGAGENLSIWKPKTTYSGFYALGHNAFGNYGAPQGIMVMVLFMILLHILVLRLLRFLRMGIIEY